MTGRALMAGDFAAFSACFAVPLELDTFDGRRLIETREDLRATFEAVCGHYRQTGVTELVRHCQEATAAGPDTILALHQTRLVAGAQLVQQPYPALTQFRRVQGRWYIVAIRYAITDSPRHNAALLATGRAA